ncbi:hypothetical protein SNE40_012316 [Patella caerulea]|uniref:Uncharacterized protein n=1 Tax=Patella caerulea TaxID=87958 RepID=A0AAN8JRD1_PATCE
MADTMLQEHLDVGNNGEKALPKGFYPNYFHQLRFIRDNLDSSIQVENMKNFGASPWYSKNMENVVARYHSISETNAILKNLIYRNSVVTQTASGVGGGDAEEFAGNSKNAVAGSNAPTYRTRRLDNLKTWTDYGNFDRNHEKQDVGPKFCENGIVNPEGAATTSISKTNEVDSNISKHISSTDGQFVQEAVEELKDAGKKEIKTDKGRPNFLTKLWRRITRKSNKKTSCKTENKVNETGKKQSRFSSLLCSRQPKTML